MKRTVIYKDMGTVLNKDMKYSALYLDGKETDLETALETLINVSRETKAEVFVAYSGLKYQRVTVLNYLHMLGYTYIKAPKNMMHVGDMRGRFSRGTCYYIQVKTGYKSYVTLQGVDNVVGAKKPCESLEELGKRLELYHLTRDKFLDGLKRQETRILYSSASISRTLFNRQSHIYSKSSLLHKGKISIGNEILDRNVWLEEWARPAVHSGYNYMDPRAYKYSGEGIVLDVNSLYPYVASTAALPLPYIETRGEGAPDLKYIRHKSTYYTFMKVEVSAKLKDGCIPCIMGDGAISDIASDYLEKMDRRVITMSEADRKLLYENYRIFYFRIKEYIVFRTSKNQFKDYIKPLYDKKKVLKRGDPERDYVKSMLVGFIGTFAKIPYKTDYEVAESNGFLSISHSPVSGDEYRAKLKRTQGLAYLNVAIVSAARYYIIGHIKKHLDRFLYTDTDSIHLMGYDIPDDIPVSDELGDFKIEHKFSKCIYKTLKNYIFVEDGKIIPTVAGIPKDTFEHLATTKDTDTDYILKALIKKDLTKLYEKPIAVWHLVEDVGSGTISYTPMRGWLCNPELPSKAEDRRRKREERERKARDLWRGQSIRESAQGSIHNSVMAFNRTFKGTHMSVDDAMHALQVLITQGSISDVKNYHVYDENDSLVNALEG